MIRKHSMASGSAPTAPSPAAPPPVPVADERLAKISPMARLLRRPEIGALLAAIVVGASPDAMWCLLITSLSSGVAGSHAQAGHPGRC